MLQAPHIHTHEDYKEESKEICQDYTVRKSTLLVHCLHMQIVLLFNNFRVFELYKNINNQFCAIRIQ